MEQPAKRISTIPEGEPTPMTPFAWPLKSRSSGTTESHGIRENLTVYSSDVSIDTSHDFITI
jgi:hypothetical protein